MKSAGTAAATTDQRVFKSLDVVRFPLPIRFFPCRSGCVDRSSDFGNCYRPGGRNGQTDRGPTPMLRPMALSAHSWTFHGLVACPDPLGETDAERETQEAADDRNHKRDGVTSAWRRTLSGQDVLPQQRQSQRGGATREHPSSYGLCPRSLDRHSLPDLDSPAITVTTIPMRRAPA